MKIETLKRGVGVELYAIGLIAIADVSITSLFSFKSTE